ncbi:MAG: DUF1972 domain-containing protein [Gammaproteobacteria bacterium]
MQQEVPQKHLMILGTRGIPAGHGGFETFADMLAHHLVKRGWRVTVYCQEPKGSEFLESQWDGIDLVHIPTGVSNPLHTIWFDLRSTLDAAKKPGIVLTLGYNTALFLLWYKLHGKPNLINMDGLEWQRSKWPWPVKLWLRCNERFALWFSDYLIADNPGIKKRLSMLSPNKGISMIPYGAPAIDGATPDLLRQFDLTPGQYVLVVARGEPENSILEIVKAFTRKRRNQKLVILGKYTATNDYHRQVMQAANDDVVMLGAIYDSTILNALRFHACLYAHGHQVGGTNPSLVEALGAGNPVLAHDNAFNRWVADEAAYYFNDVDSCALHFDSLLDDAEQLSALSKVAKQRHRDLFQWPAILEQYENLLNEWHELQNMPLFFWHS